MGSLLFLYFLHPITTRLVNKTQRFNPRYDLTNPTKTPSPPFTFSLLSVILRHLYYTLQSPSPSVTTLCSFVTLSLIPLLLPPIPLLLCLLIPCYYPLFLCYPVSSSLLLPPVPLLLCLLTLCYYPLFLCYTVSSYPVSPLLILCYYPSFLCYSVLLLPCLPSLSCKECLPVLSTGAFTLSKTRPFKHAEHAFLAP